MVCLSFFLLHCISQYLFLVSAAKEMEIIPKDNTIKMNLKQIHMIDIIINDRIEGYLITNYIFIYII